ncbi:MAG: ANTAR domain-containing protein [Gemmataceae bacterium]|nr:ANTAR domain-containing protein [Gemmataceae bacterium]
MPGESRPSLADLRKDYSTGGLTEADAYRRMRGQATRGGRKVVDVAREVVAAGDVFGTLAEDGPSADGPPRHPRHAVSHANGNGNGV